MIKVRFFAMLKGIAGTETKEYGITAPIKMENLKEIIKKDFPSLSQYIDSRSLLISVNQEFATKDTLIKDGDEVGILPPFSGG